MIYTARVLITNAFYLSGVVAREFETLTGSELSVGLFLLNSLLAFKSADTDLIPYYRRYDFPLIAGEEEYYIENLFDIETLTFNLGPVRYSMGWQSRKRYFGSSRIDDILSLPLTWHEEREEGGMRIRLYFLPSSDYIAKLTGKFGLTSVTENTILTDVYDSFYIEYLRYALAEYICNDYLIDFPARCQSKMVEMVRQLRTVSPPDLTIEKRSFLRPNQAFNWAQINIGQGYSPP